METSNTQDALITDIKSRIKVEVTPKYPTGTLIRFNRKDGSGVKRKYAALFAAKRWWTTSAVRGLAIMSDEQFFELMGRPEVSKVEVATGFERIK
ncbi:hypothetical protein SEA_MOLEFICENT_17 [Microbacterium phage Moleficent]|uniref:Uncharacterized protein n=5 Tax=Akonivirus TaxID=2842540 RepID=A0A6M3T423_9CAUD|nr:hypothetical protein HWD33_gp17 [Microbacterium phage Phedro]QJD52869.1 hypothetical protein SEA_PHRACTURED_17 [Microbacterium phage Phractured]QJD52979.1 hypothetical protein SEA_PHARKY_17 [Microbacterium phage Pharky]QNL30319.1 hypothetical protein SEA_MAZUN_17 [Microbacterium phage Mazun]QWY82709.1 hypothetical protein SEA_STAGEPHRIGHT_17 [Microbacterium phage StagePhright]UXE04106.1 hypothetical protein Fullmetal_17 [Microbacterium phage Fullmetal]WNM74521.1 hypothetical protein SEA_MO